MKREVITKQIGCVWTGKRKRKEWGFNPVTRVIQDKTKYTRKEKHKNGTK
jgi:hypothetical protein